MPSWEIALLIQLGLLVALLLVGMPVVFAFFAVNLVGAWVFLGGVPGLDLLVRNAFEGVTSFALVPIPLFILMGEVLYHTGLAARAIDAVDRLIRRVPGRLALVAISGGTVFAALSGSSVANTAMLGSTLLPDMRRRGYHPSVSVGPILATGGIAILIPPSALAVLLGSLGRIPITELLIAGIVPGVLMALLFGGYVVVRCWLDPTLAPGYELERLTWRERLVPFLVHVVPLSALFMIVVGTMLGGIASPNEASALGAVGAFVMAALYRSLSWEAIKVSLRETAKISGMILFIMCASITFSQILTFSGATQGLLDLISRFEITPMVLVLSLVLVLLFLGCFMDQLSMMMITLPFFMPLANQLGVDLIWIGVIMLVMLEIGFTTPPFGLLLFIMKGVAPPDITMRQIIVSVLPFIGLALLTVALMIVFPPLATWLPAQIVR
jgi:tripartite ATP-independent transporter DctM subunit